MIWTRKELKEQAKEALQRNYWRIVLVSFLALLFCNGIFAGGGGGSGRDVVNSTTAVNIDSSVETEGTAEMPETAASPEIQNTSEYSAAPSGNTQIVGITIFILIAILAVIVLYILQVLLIFPLQVGISRFMIKSIDDRAKVSEITYGFDHSYKNIIKTMFHYDIRIFLWALLFIIPGFYKQYQYRMVPYILAEHPDLDYRTVLKRSADMMNGHKWKAFMLDLSFILWHLGGLMTCGILEIFYVIPYQDLTSAALYRKLSMTEAPLPEQIVLPGETSSEVKDEL